MDVIPHDRDSGPLKDEEKQRLLNALNDLGEPADDSAGTDHAADKVLTADEASGDTDHGPLDFFNNYNAFGTFERLGNDMSWTSTPQLWKITASTERHECHRLKMVKNRRLEKQIQSAKKGDTRQFRPSGRPPRHAFELLGTGEREIAEAMSCFGQTLQRFSFEMSTREAQAENNHAEELDPSHCLIVKMFKTDIKLKKTPEEIRSFGRQILVRDADDTHFFENDLDGISLVSSVNTSDVIRLVVPKDPDLYGQLIGCIGTSAVRMDLQGSQHQAVQIQDALCGAWTAVPVMYVGGKFHITHIDARQGTANVVWTDETSHIADIATCWWNPYQICATTSRPSCTMKLFDIRKMNTFLEDMGLPERGELRYRHHPLHKDRRFESAWCRGKSPWMFSFCLGGYDMVFRSMGHAHGASSSYHHDLESCGAFDSCEGCGAVRLENRAQSSLALVQYMANTGPTAVWLEHPQPYTARSSMTSSPNDPADKESDQSRQLLESLVGSILTALPVSDTSLAGDKTALKQGIVARMLEHFEAESDCCAQFPVLWGILQEEMRTSNPEVGTSKAALLVLGGSCELRLTLSDAQFTVEVPPNALSSLDKYLDEQIAGSCLVIPLFLGTVSAPSTFFPVCMLISSKTDQALGLSSPQRVRFLSFSCLFVLTWWCLL